MNSTEISHRLRRSARWLRLAALGGAGLWLLATVLAVFAPQPLFVGFLAARLETGGLPDTWGAAIALVLAVLVAAALWHLARMLGEVERGAVFAPASTRHFRRFAGLLLLATAMQLLLPAIAAIAAGALENADSVSVSFSAGDFLALLLAAMFFFIARLFDQAALLEEDNRSIV